MQAPGTDNPRAISAWLVTLSVTQHAEIAAPSGNMAA